MSVHNILTPMWCIVHKIIPLLDMLIYRCRATIYGHQIDHDDMRGLIRHLKNGRAIWYSPDQDFGLKQGVMAPFFGVPACDSYSASSFT